MAVRRDAVLWSLMAFVAASFVHFTHNAEFLADYPHMPPWLTREGVYASWIAVAAIGVVGYVLRRWNHALGSLLLAISGVSGVLVLTHYMNAGPSAHTTAMNVTIWMEAVTALALLIAVFRRVE